MADDLMRTYLYHLIFGCVWIANGGLIQAQAVESYATSDYGDFVYGAAVDHRDVYVVTSKVKGKFPKIGPLRHASIAICPPGVSPIRYENGIAVSNCQDCVLYGTQIREQGFGVEQKRIGAVATRVCNVSATTVEQRMREHYDLNRPLVNDCRHHVIQVLDLRNRRGRPLPARRLK